jgi:hypothetical protein
VPDGQIANRLMPVLRTWSTEAPLANAASTTACEMIVVTPAALVLEPYRLPLPTIRLVTLI